MYENNYKAKGVILAVKERNKLICGIFGLAAIIGGCQSKEKMKDSGQYHISERNYKYLECELKKMNPDLKDPMSDTGELIHVFGKVEDSDYIISRKEINKLMKYLAASVK